MCYSNILYHDISSIEGNGLFSKINIKKGTCIGLLARVYGDAKFDDIPYGIYINHSQNCNINLKITIDKKKRIIYVIGIAKDYIRSGEELTADYNSKYAPKPNFLNENSFNFDSYF